MTRWQFGEARHTLWCDDRIVFDSFRDMGLTARDARQIERLLNGEPFVLGLNFAIAGALAAAQLQGARDLGQHIAAGALDEAGRQGELYAAVLEIMIEMGAWE